MATMPRWRSTASQAASTCQSRDALLLRALVSEVSSASVNASVSAGAADLSLQGVAAYRAATRRAAATSASQVASPGATPGGKQIPTAAPPPKMRGLMGGGGRDPVAGTLSCPLKHLQLGCARQRLLLLHLAPQHSLGRHLNRRLAVPRQVMRLVEVYGRGDHPHPGRLQTAATQAKTEVRVCP